MRHFLFCAVAVSLSLLSLTQPTQAASAPACGNGTVTVGGVTAQREFVAQPEPTTNFILNQPDCGTSRIAVVLQGALPCGNGVHVMVVGTIQPISAAGIPVIVSDKAKCMIGGTGAFNSGGAFRIAGPTTP